MSEGGGYVRNSYLASLILLQQQQFSPATVIDVGAAEGAFFLVRAQARLFPEAVHFFIDAMQENEKIYQPLAEKFGAIYEIAAVSCMDGEVVIRIDPDFYNTHVDHLQPATTYGETRRVPVSTLDGLVARRSPRPPYFVKLDVQGGEIDVLRGALRTLEDAVIVTAEIQIFTERDTLVELLAFMSGQGWALFDLTDQAYYPSNSTLYQCYATFIPKSLDSRRSMAWILPEQEKEAREGLRARRAATIEALDKLALGG